MFISVLARRLRPDKTYDDFVAAWYPEKGFGFPGRGPFLAPNVDDDREIIAVGLVELESQDELDAALARVAEQEAARHARIDEVIESTTLRGIYEVTAEYDFSSDESVARGRRG